MEAEILEQPETRRRFSMGQLALFVLIAVAVSVAATFWIVRTYVFPSQFDPVELSQRDQQALNEKLRRLGWQAASAESGAAPEQELTPEPYRERDEDREIRLTEKELNGLLASKTDMARRVALDLSDNLASAKLLIPVPPDFPIMPGRTVRVSAGLELNYAEGRPIVALQGVSIMGVPLPNAWLGNMKNVDLVREFGADGGFWKAFADGVDQVEVREGALLIKLRR